MINPASCNHIVCGYLQEKKLVAEIKKTAKTGNEVFCSS